MHTMYKVKCHGKTIFLGRSGDCWNYLRGKFGAVPVKEIMDAGYQIEPARKSAAMAKALDGISA